MALTIFQHILSFHPNIKAFLLFAHFYHALLNNLGWKDRGIVYAGGNMNAGSILQKPEQLKAAFDLGASL